MLAAVRGDDAAAGGTAGEPTVGRGDAGGGAGNRFGGGRSAGRGGHAGGGPRRGGGGRGDLPPVGRRDVDGRAWGDCGERRASASRVASGRGERRGPGVPPAAREEVRRGHPRRRPRPPTGRRRRRPRPNRNPPVVRARPDILARARGRNPAPAAAPAKAGREARRSAAGPADGGGDGPRTSPAGSRGGRLAAAERAGAGGRVVAIGVVAAVRLVRVRRGRSGGEVKGGPLARFFTAPPARRRDPVGRGRAGPSPDPSVD